LVKTKLVSSRSEAKRLIMQKGVKIDGIIQKDWKKIIKIKKGEVIQIGKRKFVKLV
jgi:tyrosyl-tRNA synthetase